MISKYYCQIKNNLTMDMVKREITDLDFTKSSGFEELILNTKCLKICLMSCIKQFTDLLNKCITIGIFPNSWKEAIVVPILKQGNLREVDNMRPISLLPATGKILEKFMNFYLTDHMESNNLYYFRQGGFRKGHSTTETTYHLLNYILENRNLNKYGATVYIDLKKAFNTVNHDILLKKLVNLGLNKIFIKLVCNYLTNRKQRVKLGKELSSCMLINDGVPQGSILGPSLFLCYINYLKWLNIKGYFNLYADDTSITVAGVNGVDVTRMLNADLSIFAEWCNLNKLTIYIKKSKVLPYYSSSQHSFLSKHDVKINNLALEIVDNYTYLGVRIDANLKMHSHLSHLYTSTVNAVYSLCNLDAMDARLLPLDIRRNITLLKLMFIVMQKNQSDAQVTRFTRSATTRNFDIMRPRTEWYR